MKTVVSQRVCGEIGREQTFHRRMSCREKLYWFPHSLSQQLCVVRIVGLLLCEFPKETNDFILFIVIFQYLMCVFLF